MEQPLVAFVGLTTLDVVQRVPRLPGPDEKLTSSLADLAAGGPAANAAKTHAALGGRARLLTVLGEGPAARLVRADLESFGVAVVDLGEPDAAPPVATVLVTHGRRAVVNSPGTGRALLGEVGASLDAATLVLLDGHHPDLAVAAAREAAARGAEVVLDAGRPKPVWAALLPLAGTVICSADFRMPAPERPTDASAADEIASSLAALGVRRVAVTAGAGPLRWWDADALPASGAVLPPPVDAVDTLGAGDVLHGAYCYHATSGLPFATALGEAARLASARCAHAGLNGWLRSLTS